MPPDVIERVVNEVERDLRDGTWDARHGRLRLLDEHDAGLRLIVTSPRSESNASSDPWGRARRVDGQAATRGTQPVARRTRRQRSPTWRS